MKRLLNYICFAALSVSILACSRSSDTVGPDICPSESFTFTPLSFKDNASGTPSIDLSSSSYGKVTMGFSEAISYKITLSAASGAEFVYESKGSSIDLNWYGNSTNGKSFAKNDFITCKVTNICRSEPLGASGQATLTTIISYNTGPWLKFLNFEEGYAFSQYSNNANIPGSTISPSFVSSGPTYQPSPQGGTYIHAEAQCPSNSYYFGGMGLTYPGFSAATLGSNPDDVYLNIYVKGVSNSQCQIILAERVFGSLLNRKFLATATGDWQLFSVKLRDLGVIDPSKIETVDFNLGTVVPAQTCNFDADLIIFTKGKPL